MCSYSAHILLWLNIIGESLYFRPNSSLSFLVQTLSTPLFYLMKQLTLWVWEELLDDLWSKREKNILYVLLLYGIQICYAVRAFIVVYPRQWKTLTLLSGLFYLVHFSYLKCFNPEAWIDQFFFHCTVKHIEFVNDQWTICICFNFHISCFPVPDVSISSSWYMVRLCYVACEEWFYGFCLKNISASSKSNPW